MEKSLDRFLIAQQNFYHDAYTELKSGKKRSHWMPFAFLAAFMACPKALKSYFSTSLPIVNSPYYILQFTFLSEMPHFFAASGAEIYSSIGFLLYQKLYQNRLYTVKRINTIDRP